MRSVLRIIFLRFLPFLVLTFLVVGSERLYYRIHASVIDLGEDSAAWLTVPTGAGFKEVKDSLYTHRYISNKQVFEKYVELGNYSSCFKPGKYLLTNRMSTRQLVDMLIRGLQTPVRVTFHNIRTRDELAGKISRQIEADSLSLRNLMFSKDYLKKYNVTPGTVFNLMIPNTYEMWWNSSAEQFFARMYRESQVFWMGKRTRETTSIGLSLSEVVILASIVEKETAMNDEKPVIAGVYMNRLHMRWPLQADPTLIFAWNDFTIKRVLNRHKEIHSPYNTYKHRGLPPAPICIPSIASIDAVLNYRHHNYLYFCARDDFSGYHVFTDNLREHSRNARKYQEALVRKLTIDN
ncbi:MAG: endolytic transglycosylase MltG [bacterium]